MLGLHPKVNFLGHPQTSFIRYQHSLKTVKNVMGQASRSHKNGTVLSSDFEDGKFENGTPTAHFENGII